MKELLEVMLYAVVGVITYIFFVSSSHIILEVLK